MERGKDGGIEGRREGGRTKKTADVVDITITAFHSKSLERAVDTFLCFE